MLRALVYIVPVALAVYALVDLVRSQESERSGLPAPAWVAIIVLVPVLGPIIWLVLSRRTTGGVQATGGPSNRPRPPRRSGPVAPDDDPDFLWRIEQEQRRRRRSRPDTEGGTPEGTDDSSDEDGPATPTP